MTEHTPEYGPRHLVGSYVSTNSANERPAGRYTDTEFVRPARLRETATAPVSAAAGTGAIGLAAA
jgi:hypothetical protein